MTGYGGPINPNCVQFSHTKQPRTTVRLDPVASLRVEVRLDAASPLSLTGSGQRSDLLESKVIQRCQVMSRGGPNFAHP